MLTKLCKKQLRSEKMLKDRLLNPNVPFARRSVQAANIILEAAFGRYLGLVHVLEHPKCGGSWVRNMIRTYLGTELFLHDRLIRPREVIMSHRLHRRRFRKPIVVVRDPRDMYVSYYHFQTSYEISGRDLSLNRHFHHDPARPVEEDFADYLRARLLYPAHPWFYYSQFLDSWLNRPKICVVRYEDCLRDPEAELVRMIRFLGHPIDLERIRSTVEATSFKTITQEKYGKAREAGREDNTKFHRKGVVGDWRNYFNEEACRLLQKIEGYSLWRLGYEKDETWIDRFLSDRRSRQDETLSNSGKK